MQAGEMLLLLILGGVLLVSAILTGAVGWALIVAGGATIIFAI